MQSDVNGMQVLIRKEKAFVVMLLTALAILNPAFADDNKSNEWNDIELWVSNSVEFAGLMALLPGAVSFAA